MDLKLTRRNFLKLLSLISLASLHSSKAMVEAFSSIQSTQQQNILIFVFDALSARHMPIYGYARNTTPNLTHFAEKAIVYHSHHTGGNFTTPSVASLLTGVYPWTHRAIHLRGTVLETFIERNIFSLYPKNGFAFTYTHNPLAELLLHQFHSSIDLFKPTRELTIDDPKYSDHLFPSDYNVSSWSEQLILLGEETTPSSLFGGLLYLLLRLPTIRRILNVYKSQFPLGVPNIDDVYFILDDAINWLIDELPILQKPYLGYFHVLPPHAPYFPRKEFIGKFKDDYKIISKPLSLFSEGKSDETLNNRCREYDEYLAYADEEFGRLYDAIARNGVLDNSIVIVTADHGELFERGIEGHLTPTMYEPLLHIPLLISIPGQTKRRDIHFNTSGVDLLPTFAKFTNQAIPNWAEGQVLPGFSDNPTQKERSIFSVEAKSSPKYGNLNKVSVALIKGNYKLIYYRGYANTPAPELYDLSNDPEELQDIASTEPCIVTDLQQEIENKLLLTNSF
jgi:arylsulfatase A-like enzyme